MKTILKKISGHFRENGYYYLYTVLTLGLLALGVFCFPNAIGRLVESGRDLGLSVAYVFCDLFEIEANITPTVNNLPDYSFLNVQEWLQSLFEKPSAPPAPSVPSVPSTPPAPLPSDWEIFKEKWSLYWEAFIDTRNMLLYFYYVLYYVSLAVTVLMFAIPAWFGIKKLFKKYYFREPRKSETEEEQKDETRPIKESKPLRFWHWLYFHTVNPVIVWLARFFLFVKERDELWQFWLLLLLLYFNVFTVFIELGAYYLYFAVSFDFISLYQQVYKLILDLSALFSMLGAVCWITVIVLALRKKSEALEYEEWVQNEVE